MTMTELFARFRRPWGTTFSATPGLNTLLCDAGGEIIPVDTILDPVNSHVEPTPPQTLAELVGVDPPWKIETFHGRPVLCKGGGFLFDDDQLYRLCTIANAGTPVAAPPPPTLEPEKTPTNVTRWLVTATREAADVIADDNTLSPTVRAWHKAEREMALARRGLNAAELARDRSDAANTQVRADLKLAREELWKAEKLEREAYKAAH